MRSPANERAPTWKTREGLDLEIVFVSLIADMTEYLPRHSDLEIDGSRTSGMVLCSAMWIIALHSFRSKLETGTAKPIHTLKNRQQQHSRGSPQKPNCLGLTDGLSARRLAQATALRVTLAPPGGVW
jgi:hypothetical protein